jgi:hypothetical protein
MFEFISSQVGTNDLKILSNTRQYLNGEYMSPATINIIRSSNKAPEIFVKFHPNLDFLNNFHDIFQFQVYSSSVADTCGQMYRQTDGRKEGRT